MKTCCQLPSLPVALLLFCGLASKSLCSAEMRTWTSVDGRTLQGSFEDVSGSNIVIKTTDGRTVNVPRTRLSQGDLRYLQDIAADMPAPTKGLGATSQKKPDRLPIPALEAKIDPKAFTKKKDSFSFNDLYFDTVETPHFMVNSKGRNCQPDEVAECAERLWSEMAFYHPSFASKWGTKRMTIFLTENQSDYDALGKWYREMLTKANPSDEQVRQQVAELATTWPQCSSGSIWLDAETAERFKSHAVCPVLKITEDPPAKGVWVPFRTHCLAGELLYFQAGGALSAAGKGEFALFAGFAFFKEIQLCGESQTKLLSARYQDGGELKEAAGFVNSKDWSGELKSILRRGEYVIKATARGGVDTKIPVPDLISIERIFNLARDNATPADLALIYGLVAFMHSSFDRVTAFSKFIDTLDKSRQIPAPAEMVKTFGHDTVEAFQEEWLKWLKSPQFK